MKIIEYSLGLPPLRRGGLTRYSIDLTAELAKGNEVYFMYPGQINPLSRKVKISFRHTSYPFKVIELKNMLPVSLGLGIDMKHIDKFIERRNLIELKSLIKRINPKVVHFHTLMGVPKELLEYLHNEKIKIIFTTHDFYGLCPKILKNNPLVDLTTSSCTYDCMLCKQGPSYFKLLVMQTHVYEKIKETSIFKKIRRNSKKKLNNIEIRKYTLSEAKKSLHLREYYLKMYSLIDEFHFNSGVSREYIRNFFPNCSGKIVPITHTGLTDQRSKRYYIKHDKLHIGYVGPYDQKKGFFRLLNVFKKMENVVLDCYGDVSDTNLFDLPNINNHGIVKHDCLIKAFQEMDVLVLPSLWHETFGFVVLEALLQGTPCLVSDNVGAKDLLPKQFIFKSDNELLNKLVSLEKTSNLAELRFKTDQLTLMFNMQKHSQEIENVFYK